MQERDLLELVVLGQDEKTETGLREEGLMKGETRCGGGVRSRGGGCRTQLCIGNAGHEVWM